MPAAGPAAPSVRELVRRGSTVRAVSRSGHTAGATGAQAVAADVTDAAALREAVKGAAVIYHCVNVPYQQWVAEFQPLTRRITDAAAAVDAQLVFTDNLYCLRAGRRTISEEAPLAAASRKGQVRAAVRADLLSAHRDGRVRVVSPEPPTTMGPSAPTRSPASNS